MGTMNDTHLLGVFVFFLTLNTIVVSARLYVRLWMKKSAFGWDDVFLLLTYVRTLPPPLPPLRHRGASLG